MTAYYKQKAYKDAAPSWRIVLKTCPQSTKNIYIIGAKIMEDYIATTKDLVLKEKYIDTLLNLHDLRIQYFPENRVNYLKAKKAQDIIRYKGKTGTIEAFNILQHAVSEGISELDASDLESYMSCFKIMVLQNKKTCGDLVNAYIKVTSTLSKRDASNPGSSSAPIQKITDYCSSCLDCKTLDSLYSASFTVNKNDTNWLDNGINLLNEKKCNSSKTLLLLLEQRFTTKPTSKTASILGMYYFNAQKKDKAEVYFEKAIDLETSNEKMGGHYINKAKLYLSNNQYSLAKSYANKALTYKGGVAFDAYLIMGDAVAYSATSCKGLAFQGKEVYWVAVDYYNKASNNASDAGDKATANKRIAKFSSYFPEKGELFLKSLSNGNSYKVECWINENTTVRSK